MASTRTQKYVGVAQSQYRWVCPSCTANRTQALGGTEGSAMSPFWNNPRFFGSHWIEILGCALRVARYTLRDSANWLLLMGWNGSICPLVRTAWEALRMSYRLSRVYARLPRTKMCACSRENARYLRSASDFTAEAVVIENKEAVIRLSSGYLPQAVWATRWYSKRRLTVCWLVVMDLNTNFLASDCHWRLVDFGGLKMPEAIKETPSCTGSGDVSRKYSAPFLGHIWECLQLLESKRRGPSFWRTAHWEKWVKSLAFIGYRVTKGTTKGKARR